jgi:uncharacterized protein YpmB
MKKWLFIGAITVVTLFIWQAVFYYVEIFDKQQSLQEKATNRAFSETELQSIDDVDYYHGKHAYIVLFGVNEEGKELIVWVPEENEQDIVTKLAEEGWTEEDVKEYIKKERKVNKIRDIHLGIEDGRPLWEVIYLDEQNRYTYYYVNFENGEFLKRYSIKKKQYKGEF